MTTSTSMNRCSVLMLAAMLAGGCLMEVGPEQEVQQQEQAVMGVSHCSPRTYYVDARASATVKASGTQFSPFRRIGDALSRAAALGLCQVTVRIASGTYREDLTVTKSTRLLGASRGGTVLRGRILHTHTVPLHVERLTITRAGYPGAVVSTNPHSTTTIRDVTISNAFPYGVVKNGGTLNLSLATIQSTLPGYKNLRDGTAVMIKGGATAYLSSVLMRDNAQGLVAGGAGTRVRAYNVTVQGCRWNTWFKSTLLNQTEKQGFAAVEIYDGALLYARWLNVLNNELGGLTVHHNGQANVRYGRFIGTTLGPMGADGGFSGGHNIEVRRGGTLQLQSFESAQAEFTGVRAFNGGLLAMSHGTVHHNIVAVSLIASPGIHEACLMSGVVFSDYTRRLDASPLPVPLTSSSPAPVCPTVSW